MSRSIYEKAAHKQLEALGYQVDYKSRPFRVPRGYSVDFLGLFDLLAYKDGELRCIAIKGHQGVPSKLRKGIENFQPTRIVREIWVYRPDGTLKQEVIEKSDNLSAKPLS